MTAALDVNLLKENVSKKYDFYEKRIVGIMMARYDRAVVKKMIEDCQEHGYCSAGEELDIFWAGYGKGLDLNTPDDEKTILDYAGNDGRIYFESAAFLNIKDKLYNKSAPEEDDHVQLALVGYEKGKLDFHKSLFIDLEINLDTDYKTIQKIMSWLAKECIATHDVVSLAKNLKRSRTLDSLEGVTLSDALNISSHLVGATV